jgi:regulator of ribonuclease activity A
MSYATADISDAEPDACRLCSAELQNFGRRRTFWGQAVTLRVRDDYRPALRICMEPGQGKLLVIDGGGLRRAALLGATMARLAWRNGWAGAIVFGAVRDTEELGTCDFGVKALGTTPRSAPAAAAHERGIAVHFGEVTFHPGDWVYADADGIVVRATAYQPAPVDDPA